MTIHEGEVSFSPISYLRTKKYPPRSWWLAGGIAAANCVAAYQPKGAASYAASKVNLANPGTYDLVKITNDPDFDAATGWTFDASSVKALDSESKITLTYDSTIIACFTTPNSWAKELPIVVAVGPVYPFGFQIQSRNAYNVNKCYSSMKNVSAISSSALSTNTKYVVCCLGNYEGKVTQFIDGSKNGQAAGTDSSFSVTNKIRVGQGETLAGYGFNGVVACCAIYNATLTSTQVGLLTTAMAAL